MITTESKKTYVSDITGQPISEENWVRVRFSVNGQTYLLDADRNDGLIGSLVSHARATQQGRPNGNGTSNN